LIKIRGAKTHNLKDIDLDIPRNQFVVITGLSGSGKSSLAFDTLYAEGQRRYVESLSAYARQFLSMMEKPDVELIEGLSPAIAIEQKVTSHNPRSTVGTITEIYDYLRLLFARVGQAYCPEHHKPLSSQTISQIVDSILQLPEDTKINILAPAIRDRKGEHTKTLQQWQKTGFVRARVNGKTVLLSDPLSLDPKQTHQIDIVVDRLKVRKEHQQRLSQSVETAAEFGQGLVIIAMDDQPDQLFSTERACPDCGFSIDRLEPKQFSFNSPAGACKACDGLGMENHFDPERLIIDPSLSLDEGVIIGWDKRYYLQILQSLAHHEDFSMHTPWQRLSESNQQKILYGTKYAIELRYDSLNGRSIYKRKKFEGVIPTLERRYRETDSSDIRTNLSRLMSEQACSACNGTRLNTVSSHVLVGGLSLHQMVSCSIDELFEHLSHLKLNELDQQVAVSILTEIKSRVSFLQAVGLNYLSLSRKADSLSGGESQRIRLASQIGSGLVGVMYVLDEPSIGLHQRDNDRLLSTLIRLRDLGNTVLVVEHDEDAIIKSDHIIDIGPGAGVHGGQVVATGTYQDIMNSKDSVTGQYLSKKRVISNPSKRRSPKPDRFIRILGACENNLKQVDVEIPIGVLTAITGVSGSGKSTLINGTLYPLCAQKLNRTHSQKPGEYDNIEGLEYLDKVVRIDQSPIGRTPRSNPATYTGLLGPIRDLFSMTPEARARGYRPGRFSFNVRGGRCEACEGDGMIRVAMHFLPDVYVTCDQCNGQRYNRETLEIQFKEKNIAQVLDMTVEDALIFFENIPLIARKCQLLKDVGLGYIRLGQSATTLSGGEAQRIKLSKELSKRSTGQTIYILDEPTTGLHFHDIQQLLNILHRLTDQGNTIVIIEHNLDVIKTADWIIDLGPEGGHGGGQIIACGTPETVAQSEGSFTGQYLKKYLS
tara:strand:- start:2759 stop:5560 length:2802 start_codon:yes stop_codon:yes gene_type:complete